MTEELLEPDEYWRESLGEGYLQQLKKSKATGLSVAILFVSAALILAGFSETIREALINPAGNYLKLTARQDDSKQKTVESTTSIIEDSAPNDASTQIKTESTSTSQGTMEPASATSTTLLLSSPLTSSSSLSVSSCPTACLKYFNESGECVDEPVSCRGNKNHVLKSASTYCKSLSQKYDTCCCMGD